MSHCYIYTCTWKIVCSCAAWIICRKDPYALEPAGQWGGQEQSITWISGTTFPLSAQDPANAVSGAGDTTGLGLVKLLRSQLGMSFSSCRITMVSMTKKRPHGNQSVCSWVMNGARSKCRAMAMPPLVTKSKLEHRCAQCQRKWTYFRMN